MSDTRIDISLAELEQQVVYGNGWTESASDIVEEWLQNASTLATKHAKAASMFKKNNRYLLGLVLVFSTSVTALSLFNVGGPSEQRSNQPAVVALAVISSMSTFLAQLSAMLKFEGRAEKHMASSNEYQVFSNEMKQQLFLPSSERDIAKYVLERFTLRLEKINEKAPLVPNRIK
jgi:hypothetical protein